MTSQNTAQMAALDPQGSTKSQSRKKRHIFPYVIIGVIVLLLIVTIGFLVHYRDRSLPGSQIGSTSIGGMTEADLTKLIAHQADNVKLSLKGDAAGTDLTLKQTGITVNAAATAKKIIADNSSFFKPLAFWKSHDYKAITNGELTPDQAQKLLPSTKQAKDPVNAAIKFAKDSGKYVVTPAVIGRGLSAKGLDEAALQAASTLQNRTLDIHIAALKPQIGDDAAKAVADLANQTLATPIELQGQNETLRPDHTLVASWLQVSASAKKEDQVKVNSELIKQWVDSQAERVQVAPVNGLVNVNSAGKVVQKVRDAVAGKKLDKLPDLVSGIASALQERKPYQTKLQYVPLPATTQKRVIADGAEKLPYKASPGEKWVDVNLTTREVRAYEGAKQVFPTMLSVTGGFHTPTRPGLFHVYLKLKLQTMRGNHWDGTPYAVPNVPWIMYFDEGRALHGAWWRTKFGPGQVNDTQGCVNLPIPAAHELYGWTEIGTPVMVHN